MTDEQIKRMIVENRGNEEDLFADIKELTKKAEVRNMLIPETVVKQIIKDYQQHLVELLRKEQIKLDVRLGDGDIPMAHRTRILNTIALIEKDTAWKPYSVPTIQPPSLQESEGEG